MHSAPIPNMISTLATYIFQVLLDITTLMRIGCQQQEAASVVHLGLLTLDSYLFITRCTAYSLFSFSAIPTHEPEKMDCKK
jgi:hypothetical protein